jgi:hypothetical protein
MKKIVLYILLLATILPLRAQDDPQYRMEIGAGAGVMGYLGDFNSSITKDLQPMASIVGRYNFDTYKVLKVNVQYGKIKGVSTDEDTYYQAYAAEPYKFDNSLISADLTFEYNFWPYGTGRDYRGAQRLTPFVFGGLGATFVSMKDGSKKSAFGMNVPIGLGLKYKVNERLNLGLEWAMHFSTSDELDGVADPYDIKSSGMFKNTDCYSTLQMTITYSFSAKCRTCHNEDE